MASNIYLFTLVTTLLRVIETFQAKSTQSIFAAAVASLFVALLTTKFLSWSNQKNVHDVPFVRGIPFIGSWQFFTRRYDFVRRGLKQHGGVFRFKLVDHNVFVVSGEAWRKEFLTRKDFALQEGYRILAGGVREPTEAKSANKREKASADMAWLYKRIIAIMHKDRLAKSLPKMCEDVDRLMHKWGGKGTFYPFDDIYNMVFQLTARISICREIADDPVEVAKLTKLFWVFDKSNTALTVLLPWLPQKARRTRTETIVALYQMLLVHVVDRQTTGRREEDPMQVLIDAGDSTHDIIEFSLKVLFAGVVNTAVMTSWIPYFLAASPSWKLKAVTEVKRILSKYSPAKDSSSFLSKLSAIPPEAWEEEMPTLDLCLRETIRLIFSTVLLRRNISASPGVHVQGRQVDSGGFLVYLPTEVHHNPDIFPEPLEFDPGRYARGDGQTQASGFVGWGAGRHPCLGKRLAKLEVKVILVMLLARYDFELIDKHGDSVKKVPEPDRNNMIETVPRGDKIFIKYKRTEL